MVKRELYEITTNCGKVRVGARNRWNAERTASQLIKKEQPKCGKNLSILKAEIVYPSEGFETKIKCDPYEWESPPSHRLLAKSVHNYGKGLEEGYQEKEGHGIRNTEGHILPRDAIFQDIGMNVLKYPHHIKVADCKDKFDKRNRK